MAFIRIAYSSKRNLDLSACETVAICLTTGWETRTVSGSRIVFAQVEPSGRKLSAFGYFNRFLNIRGTAVYQYHLLIDCSQFLIDPETGCNYVITCEDICELFPYCCISSEIIRGL